MKSSTILGGIATATLLLGLTGAARADDLKLGYINKMGDHPWFVAEVAGAKAEAAKQGAKISTQDVQFNADLTLTTLDAMIGDGVQGVAIVVPDRALGPVVAEKAAKANVKLIAVDDDIKGPNDFAVPYIGMNAGEIGAQVGREEARIYKELKWDQLKDVYLGAIEDRKADTCMRRTQGAEAAFLEAVPGFDKSHIVRIPYDNTMANAIDVVTTTLTANPAAQHWIFYSCNDDGVLGAVRATENQSLEARSGDRNRNRRQPFVQRLRHGPAVRFPRHDVYRQPQGGRDSRTTVDRLDQAEHGAAEHHLCQRRPDQRRHLEQLQG